jgi:2-amino-4-hydroxy-6-hydroxymethyldihydropteridine diphosphokinase
MTKKSSLSRAVLSLGANLGDRAAALRAALTALKDDGLVARSTLYETPPWGPVEQPPYLNAIAVVRGPRDAAGWLARAHQLEQAAGRTRNVRFGPRTLDVDVIAVWTEEGEPVHSDDPELVLPHPRAHQRAFVLRPWIDIQPYGRLPGHGWLTDLLAAEPVASDVLDLRPRPDLRLESETERDTGGEPA